MPIWEEGSTRTLMPTLGLSLPGTRERQLVLAWCAGAAGDLRSAMAATSIEDILVSSSTKDWQPDARVLLETVPVERMPSQGLSYCSYDLCVLSADALNRLDSHQLAALTEWLHGGGAAGIVGHGEQLGQPAADALARVSQECGIQLMADHDHLPASGGPRLARIGLGRLAVAQPALDGATLDRTAAVFLWRVREGWASSLAHGQAMDGEALGKADDGSGRNRSICQPRNVRKQSGSDETPAYPSLVPKDGGNQEEALNQLLMPEGHRHRAVRPGGPDRGGLRPGHRSWRLAAARLAQGPPLPRLDPVPGPLHRHHRAADGPGQSLPGRI